MSLLGVIALIWLVAIVIGTLGWSTLRTKVKKDEERERLVELVDVMEGRPAAYSPRHGRQRGLLR